MDDASLRMKERRQTICRIEREHPQFRAEGYKPVPGTAEERIYSEYRTLVEVEGEQSYYKDLEGNFRRFSDGISERAARADALVEEMNRPPVQPAATQSERPEPPVESARASQMADLDFWHDLETRFRALQPKDQKRVFAQWVSIPFHEQGDQWSVHGADERVRTNFRWCAERAAVKLGHPGGSSAAFYWLDLLRSDSPHYRHDMEAVADGAARSGGTIDHVCEASADYCFKLEALPALPREAFQRIETAAREARERYERDKAPYFPLSEDFSFLEQDIFRAAGRILELLRLFTEQVLDAYLKEYLQSAPSEVAASRTLLEWVSSKVETLADDLWQGFGLALKYAPDLSQVPPESQQWADFSKRMAERDSEMSRLNERYRATIDATIRDRIEHYQSEAASRCAAQTRPEQHEPVSAHPQQPKSSSAGSHPSEGTQAGGAAISAPAARADKAEAQPGRIEPPAKRTGPREGPSASPETPPAPPERSRAQRAPRKKAAKRKIAKQVPKTRPKAVDTFLSACNEQSATKIARKHIWQAVGHKVPRQFQHWQASAERATGADDRNFRRILAMKPADFLALLKTKGLV